jgi:hypothetical protein
MIESHTVMGIRRFQPNQHLIGRLYGRGSQEISYHARRLVNVNTSLGLPKVRSRLTEVGSRFGPHMACLRFRLTNSGKHISIL